MASAASPTSTESDPPRWKHDVFLSFRGEDTRRAFMSHLDRELAYWQAMKIFKDDRDLEVGATISQELLTAIEESHLAIIVLSPNYAFSSWCLDELSKILECMEDTKRILPIFYDVDPADVRHQRGSFAEAFTKHEKRFSGDVEKLNRWRAALTKVAGLSGLHSTTYKSEAELIKDILEGVRKKVNPTLTLLDSQERLVGIDSALAQLLSLLDLEANDIRFIGICGMGGIGKTTLANLVFQKISHHFELHRFLSNVRKTEVSDLQRQLLSPILDQSINQVCDDREGTVFIKKFLRNKKVLLVLDDVDQLHQLEKLIGEKNWFGVGSRIVVTTRNERLLVEHGIEILYKFNVLNDDEALELFSQHAFKKSWPEEDFLQLAKCFVRYAKGLPLALKTLGCSLYKRGQDTWNSALDNLKKIPNPTIFDSLKISYDSLEDVDKEIFLDVACFHRGKDKEQVIETLDNIYDISSRDRIDILVEKSLFTFDKAYIYNFVEMHDLIQEMAWEIIRLESSREPGQRSRLWLRDDISHVFMNNTGTGEIVAMVLHLFKLAVVHCNCDKVFSKMRGLKLLDFDNVNISVDPKDLPNSLRLLRWSWYPSKSLPSSFHPHVLVKLEMRHSKLFRLWDGAKDLPNLKCMDLSYSDKLTNTPDFTGIPNLEKLNLKNCTNLVEVHTSIAVLKKLKRLDLSECKSIKSLPSKMEMDSLEYFSLCGCSKVKKLPEFEGHMKNWFKLILKGTAVEKIPSSIEGLVGAAVAHGISLSGQIVYMQRSSKLVKLPGEMECLEELELNESAMSELFVFMKNHKYLSFHRSSTSRDGSVWFRRRKSHPHPKSSTSKDGIGIGIGWGLDRLFGIRRSHPDPKPDTWGLVLSSLNHSCSLTSLYLSDCNIGEGVIPVDIGRCLSSLETVNLSGNNFVSLPASIRFLSNILHLDLSRCERLEQLPDLPPRRSKLLELLVDDCVVLKRLSDPSKLSKGGNVYDFTFSCVNCFRLVEKEDWINRIFAKIMRSISRGASTVWPGSKIPDWFDNRSAGDSITMELPPQPSSHWIGIALCVVFENSEYLENPAALVGYDCFEIKNRCCGPGLTFEIGHLKSQHLWAYYVPRDIYTTFGDDDIRSRIRRDGSCSHRFSFQAFYGSFGGPSSRRLKTNSSIKKCGARLVYKKDLEEFSRILKIPKPALPRRAYIDEEAGPIGSSGSGSSDDDDEPGIGSSEPLMRTTKQSAKYSTKSKLFCC